jgi:sec-independent protein translocase protein TatA
MGGFSLIHWLILGLFILLLFGGNRFSAMMKDVAKGMRSFKEGLADDDKPAERQEPRPLPRNDPIDVTPEPRRTADSVPPAGDDRTNG